MSEEIGPFRTPRDWRYAGVTIAPSCAVTIDPPVFVPAGTWISFVVDFGLRTATIERHEGPPAGATPDPERQETMPDSRQYKLAAEVLRQRAPTLSHEGRHAALDVAAALTRRVDVDELATKQGRIDRALAVLEVDVPWSPLGPVWRAIAILQTGVDPMAPPKPGGIAGGVIDGTYDTPWG